MESLLEHNRQLYQRLASLGVSTREHVGPLPQMRQVELWVRPAGAASRARAPVFVEHHHWGKSQARNLCLVRNWKKSANKWRTIGTFNKGAKPG